MGYVFGIILLIIGSFLLFSGEGKGSADSSGKGNTDIYFHE